ncbi:MAG TPA: TetR/AcrR family transcriptional regulator [Nitrospiraceae bacterium]|nr:TetR/AcrR family transcriptional regulator [Nitrospiraceae bacterium]
MMDVPAQVDVPLSRVARRKAKTNRRLLDVARKLFFEKGIYWVKVEDITESADIGKGTFYKYFDSKETIIRMLLEEGLDELLLKTKEAVHAASSDSKILSAVIAVRVDFFLTHPDYLLLFHQVRGLLQLKGDAAKELRGVYDAHLRQLARLIQPVKGTKGTAGARDAANAIAAYTSGLLTYHVLFEGIEAVKGRRDHFVRVLNQSLRAMLKTGSGRPFSK